MFTLCIGIFLTAGISFTGQSFYKDCQAGNLKVCHQIEDDFAFVSSLRSSDGLAFNASARATKEYMDGPYAKEDRALLSAVRNKNEAEVLLIARGRKWVYSPLPYTLVLALDIAEQQHSSAISKIILQELLPAYEKQAVIYAAALGCVAAIRVLVREGADIDWQMPARESTSTPNRTRGIGVNALAKAILEKQYDSIKVLVELGADLNRSVMYQSADVSLRDNAPVYEDMRSVGDYRVIEAKPKASIQELAEMSGDPKIVALIAAGQSSAGAKKRTAETVDDEARRYRRALDLAKEYVSIPPGTFNMGAERGEKNAQPVHHVRITKGFEIGKYEVTEAKWREVMAGAPPRQSSDYVYSEISGAGERMRGVHMVPYGGTWSSMPDRPITYVSWEDVQRFLKKLNEQQDGYQYRLPTEAEWEYAARAGGSGVPTDLEATAWYRDNSGGTLHSVGEKQPNGWGIYDMLGNADELCQDWYDEKYYGNKDRPQDDPTGPVKGQVRVRRGGSFYSGAALVNVARRGFGRTSSGNILSGFRCVRHKK